VSMLLQAGERDGMRAPAEPIAVGARAERHEAARRGMRRRSTRMGGRAAGGATRGGPTTKSGRAECRWRSWQGEGKRRWDWWQDGGLLRRLVADPAGDLRDGGRLEASGGGPILKAGVPSRREALAGSEVDGVRL
jgi:hypothetical protein